MNGLGEQANNPSQSIGYSQLNCSADEGGGAGRMGGPDGTAGWDDKLHLVATCLGNSTHVGFYVVVVFSRSHYLFRGYLQRMRALIPGNHPDSHSCPAHIYTSELPGATTALSRSASEPAEAESTHAGACFPVGGLAL